MKMIKIRWVLLCVPFYLQTAVAGFLDMPDTTEVPELERESLLKDMDIPSVRERDPDPQAGPRLNVTEFRLQGIVEYPELGITRGDLAREVEKIRFDMMDEDEMLESGYTLEELAELSDLIAQIEEQTGDRHVGPLEVQKLVWLIREQRQERGVTLGMIETVADKITNYYRERGFILAKAYIPEQKVRNGVVSLTLLLGKLGRVEVHDNEMYSAGDIRSVFDDMMTMPVTDFETEEHLYLLNDYPGLAVTGFFEPGNQIGDSKLNVNVRSEDPLEYNVRLDNHGSDRTGENRLYAEVFWNNPFGLADQMKLAGLRAEDPAPSTFYEFRYDAKPFSPRIGVSLGVATNEFILASTGSSQVFDVLDLNGETIRKDFTLSYVFQRSRARNYSLDLIGEEIESSVSFGALEGSGSNSKLFNDGVRNTSLRFNFDVLREESRILHKGNVKLTSGKFLFGAEEGQEDTYELLNADYTFLTFWQVPWIDVGSRIVSNTSLQYASGPLSSISQSILGGPTGAKAYSLNAFSGDDSLYTGVSWIFDGPQFVFDGRLQPMVFVDAAYGRVRPLAENEDTVTGRFVDAGVGLQLASTGGFKGNLLFAFPVEEEITPARNDEAAVELDQGTRVLFDLQYSF